MTEKTVDVETIDILLIGSKDEIAEAVNLIDANFKEKIFWVIRQKVLSADSEDLFDIYCDTLLGIYQYAQEGKYDPDKQRLPGLIYRIASNKAIDWLRKKYAQKRNNEAEQDVLVASVAEIIKDSGVYEAWQCAHQNEERAVILKTIRNLTRDLKTRQRQVAEIIIVNFPNCLSNLEIKQQILHRWGDDITTLAVKSARQEVYAKVKEALSTTGYGDYVND